MRDRSVFWLPTLYAFGLALVLCVWVGGSLLTDFFVVPEGFRTLPRDDAIAFGRRIFERWNFIECFLGALGILFAFGMGRAGWGTARRHWTATGLLAGMTVLSMAFLMVLTPLIIGKVEILIENGIEFSDLSQMPPEREALRTVHSIYMILDALKILFGFTALWLYANRRERARVRHSAPAH